jgi:outer membrane protein assembly factor BamE (lipoprotein component of BamABCDE complex)
MKNLAILILFAFLFSGCATFTKNLNKIEQGMSLEEVKQIMGKPNSITTEDDKTFYNYVSGQTTCTVTATENKVSENPKCTKNELSESISEAAKMRMYMR